MASKIRVNSVKREGKNIVVSKPCGSKELGEYQGLRG